MRKMLPDQKHVWKWKKKINHAWSKRHVKGIKKIVSHLLLFERSYNCWDTKANKLIALTKPNDDEIGQATRKIKGRYWGRDSIKVGFIVSCKLEDLKKTSQTELVKLNLFSLLWWWRLLMCGNKVWRTALFIMRQRKKNPIIHGLRSKKKKKFFVCI